MNRQTIHIFATGPLQFQDLVNKALDAGYLPMFRATITENPSYSVFMQMSDYAWERYKKVNRIKEP